MAYQPKGSEFYRLRITLSDGRTRTFPCGTTNPEVAADLERMVETFKHDRHWAPLNIIFGKRAKLGDVYDAFKAGSLEGFLAALSSPDLSPLVDKWPAGAKYKAQVRCLIPEGATFPAATFTKKRVSEFLASLTCSGSTKNRYRAALSVFAKWLVERDVIPTNVIRDVGGVKPNPGRILWLDRVQAKALVAALPMPYQAVEALMAATGAEWQVIGRLARRDVDIKNRTVHVRGGKTVWRNRVVRATELWAWEIFAQYARGFTEGALLFDGLRHSATLRTHKRIARSLDLPITTLHDWRHTYAVQALRDGYSPSIIAHQLGHRDPYLVMTRYGRHVPDAKDYESHADRASFHATG